MALFHHLLLQHNGDVDETLRMMKRLQELGYIDKDADLDEFARSLEEGKIVSLRDGVPKLTTKGERFVRREALNQIFTNLKKGAFGEHRTPHAGEGGGSETPAWTFGDGGGLDLQTTCERARPTWRGRAGFSSPRRDFARRSPRGDGHSMILYGEDRITPAKKVALALTELIRTRYPKDSLQVVLFGDDAMEVKPEELPYIGAGPFHTNTRAGLQLAQRLLSRKKHPNRQVFMITDGKASAVTENGRIYKNPFGMDPKIVSMTLEEAARCRRNRIVITTFMLTDDPTLVGFVDKLTQVNRGRAYYSSVDDLGSSVFVDYLRNRRRKLK
jgi:uncharacterized protein with von Willebrand factor type A (vWA) domain